MLYDCQMDPKKTLGGVYIALEGNMSGILQYKQYANCYASHGICVIRKINISNHSKQIAVKNTCLSIYISLTNFTSSSGRQYRQTVNEAEQTTEFLLRVINTNTHK